jgi:hypothetical protein
VGKINGGVVGVWKEEGLDCGGGVKGGRAEYMGQWRVCGKGLWRGCGRMKEEELNTWDCGGCVEGRRRKG